MTSLLQRQQRRKRARSHGNVQVQRDLDSEPRLPHERDESADSADVQSEEQRTLARQAAADIKQGMVDTDIGPGLRVAGQRLDGAPEDSAAVDEEAARQALPQEAPPTGKSRGSDPRR
jgi:hypothetical protein